MSSPRDRVTRNDGPSSALAAVAPSTTTSSRLEQRELGDQPRPAGGDVRRPGRLVDAPLAAQLEPEMLDRVGDVDVGRVDAGVVDRLAQQPAGRADERQALLVLDVAGLLADEDDPGVRGAAAEDGLGGVLVSSQPSAAGRGRLELVEAAAAAAGTHSCAPTGASVLAMPRFYPLHARTPRRGVRSSTSRLDLATSGDLATRSARTRQRAGGRGDGVGQRRDVVVVEWADRDPDAGRGVDPEQRTGRHRVAGVAQRR